MLARHMPQIVLKPAMKNGRKIYQVISQWELLEGMSELPAVDSALNSKRMVGAEGWNRTQRLAVEFQIRIAA